MNESTEVEDSFSEYQRSLRGRSSDLMTGVREALSTDPAVSSLQKRSKPATNVLFDTPSGHQGAADQQTEHSDYTYGAAADRLKTILKKHTPKQSGAKLVQFGQNPPSLYSPVEMPYMGQASVPQGLIPSPEEVLPLLQNQTAQLRQLEHERKFYQGELHVLNQKVREVVEENQSLHEELKRSVIQDILREGAEIPGVPSLVPEKPISARQSPAGGATKQMSRSDYSHWQRELERISGLHASKADRLETQLSQAREDVEKYKRELEDTKTKLRFQESMSNGDQVSFTAGLCIRCAQNEAVLPGGSSSKQALDAVTRERDELVEHVTSLHHKVELLKQREDDAYQQVKKSVELVEQAQMEQTQALIEKEQAKEEAGNMRGRIQEYLDEQQTKLSKERELVRAESKAERDDLNAKLKEFSEALVSTQLQMEKLAREKVTLMSELEDAKNQIGMWDADYGRGTETMKVGMTSATIERNAAVQEVKKLRTEMVRNDKDRQEERHRLKTELDDVRRRLNVAERDLVESKEECIQLTNTVQSLERDVHMAKLTKDSAERSRTDSVRALQERAELRETELNTLIDQMDVRHSQTVNELEDMVSSQGSLISKLQTECKKLATQLEDSTVKFKKDNKHLKNKCEQLASRLERILTRQRETEEQNARHADLHEKMRQRLRQMDSHGHHSAQQILELLAKESSLMRDRQLLAKEVEFLRVQLTSGNESDSEKLYFSGRGQVDAILHNVKVSTVDEVRKPSGVKDTNVKGHTLADIERYTGEDDRPTVRDKIDPDKDIVDLDFSNQLVDL